MPPTRVGGIFHLGLFHLVIPGRNEMDSSGKELDQHTLVRSVRYGPEVPIADGSAWLSLVPSEEM